MLTIMGTIIMKRKPKIIKRQRRTRTRATRDKEDAKAENGSAKMKQFTYKANNNNKSTASSQNTKSLINFDNNRCVFLYFFLSSVRYSPVPENIFEPRRFRARPLRFDAVFIASCFSFPGCFDAADSANA